eukprot:2283717-Rhodomonas_salina.1
MAPCSETQSPTGGGAPSPAPKKCKFPKKGNESAFCPLHDISQEVATRTIHIPIYTSPTPTTVQHVASPKVSVPVPA